MNPFRILVLAACLMTLPAPMFAAEKTCEDCHSDKTQFPIMHPAVAMGCESCHINMHPKGDTKNKGRLSAQGKALCLTCHEASKFSGQPVVHLPVKDGDCLTCHDPHGSSASALLRPDMPELCLNCHDKGSFVDRKIHGPVQIAACVSCHAPHQSKFKKLLVKSVPDLCFDCHRKSAFLGKMIHPPVRDGSCLVCHKSHAADNRDMLTMAGNETCLPCHEAVASTPHAMAGDNRNGHVLKGEKDPRRRGRPFGCTSCHTPHSSEYPKLFRYPASKPMDLCASCHRK